MAINFTAIDALVEELVKKEGVANPYARKENILETINLFKQALIEVQNDHLETIVARITSDVILTGTLTAVAGLSQITGLNTSDRFFLEIDVQAIAGGSGGGLEIDITPTTGLLNNGSQILRAGSPNVALLYAHDAASFDSGAAGNNAIITGNIKLLKVDTGATAYTIRARFSSGACTIKNLSYKLIKF